MQSTRVTIAHVARDAGVSTATVSRALNQPETVSKDTLERVQAAVARLGFRLNPAARALRRQETRRILVPNPSSANLVLAEVLNGLNAVLRAEGYVTMPMDTSATGELEDMFRLIKNREVDGVASMDARLHTRLVEVIGDMPLVYASEWPSDSEYAYVKSNNLEGGRMAAAHLIAQGHRYLGHMTGSKDKPMSWERREGFLTEMEAQGLPIDPDWQLFSNWQMTDGLALAQRIVNTLGRGEAAPTGWFCASDEMALGFIGELLKQGISVPDQISVVGFDDIPQVRFLHPALTTIRQDPISLGTAAAHALIAQLKGDAGSEAFQATVPVELVVRASTAPAKRQG